MNKKLCFILGAFLAVFPIASFALILTDNASGGDCSLIGTWDVSTKTCTLNSNLSESVEIMNDNITLNGAGHSISTTSPSSPGIGIRAVERNNITIRNLTLSGWTQAVVLDSSTSSLVENNAFSNNSTAVQAGTTIYGPASNRIIRNNTFERNRYSVTLYGAQGDLIEGNTITTDGDSTAIGILLGANNSIPIVIQNNTITGPGSAGIYSSDADFNNFLGNTVKGFEKGFFFSYCSSAQSVRGNTISDNGSGIVLEGSGITSVTRNNFVNNAVHLKTNFLPFGCGRGYATLSQPLPEGGNYWDTNISCLNQNGDGICDAPYFVTTTADPSGNGTLDIFDDLPWVKKNGWESPPFNCGKLPSGLDTCSLQPGDILLETGTINLEALLGGTYWTHAAIYLGDGKLAEAKPSPLSADQQVRVIGIDSNESDWAGNIIDWAVVRPLTSTTIKNDAAAYSRNKAEQTNPPILYNDFLVSYNLVDVLLNLPDKNREDKFYCSQLPWKAYQRQGLDLEVKPPFPVLTALWTSSLVTPDDLYYSSHPLSGLSMVVDQKKTSAGDYLARYVFRVISPVDMLLIDQQGRRTGFDTNTGVTLNEIPGTTYTGHNSEPEGITVTGVEEELSLYLVGNDVGPYTLETIDLDLSNFRNQVITRQTSPGKTDIYRIVPSAEQIVIVPNQPPIADAGLDQTARLGNLVTLNGMGSSDPDKGPLPLSFSWTQNSGPTVALTGASTASPTFTPTTIGTYIFTVTVSDGQASATDVVKIEVVSNPSDTLKVTQLLINKKLKSFFLLSNLTLGTGSNGISPVKEAVTFKIGNFTSAIPAGSLRKISTALFVYAGTINKVKMEIIITSLGNNRYAFQTAGTGVDFSVITNPVKVDLSIGDDIGTTSFQAVIK